jgi:hypothetical protein
VAVEQGAFSPLSASEPRGILQTQLYTLAGTLDGLPTRAERPRLRQLIQATIRVHRESRVHHPVLGLLLHNLLSDLWGEHVDASYYARQIAQVADKLGA